MQSEVMQKHALLDDSIILGYRKFMPFGFCKVSVWILYVLQGFCMVSAWFLYVFCMVSAWILYGFCMFFFMVSVLIFMVSV
jgi:hypothetical protein